MGDFSSLVIPHGPTIHTWSLEAIGVGLAGQGESAISLTSVVYPLANLAMFVPFRCSQQIVVAQLFMLNGATVSGNVDVGIYDEAGTKIVSSGSTVQAGVSVLQVFNIADTVLAPGDFYLAIAMDNATGTIQSTTLGNALFGRVLGLAQQATAFPLPAVATLAAWTQTRHPMIGLTMRATL